VHRYVQTFPLSFPTFIPLLYRYSEKELRNRVLTVKPRTSILDFPAFRTEREKEKTSKGTQSAQAD
jgi:hypothetical protein